MKNPKIRTKKMEKTRFAMRNFSDDLLSSLIVEMPIAFEAIDMIAMKSISA